MPFCSRGGDPGFRAAPKFRVQGLLSLPGWTQPLWQPQAGVLLNADPRNAQRGPIHGAGWEVHFQTAPPSAWVCAEEPQGRGGPRRRCQRRYLAMLHSGSMCCTLGSSMYSNSKVLSS